MRHPTGGLAFQVCLALSVLPSCRVDAPVVGDRVSPSSPAPSTGPRITVTAASVGAARKVVLTLRIERDGAGLGLEQAEALEPRFTLASLETDPSTGTPAWRSHLLLGAQTIPSLPIAGPGTPPEYVIANARQPGSEGGALVDLGGGDFQFTFATALPAGYDPAATFRAGAFLEGVARATASTCATLELVPGGGTVSQRDTVLDARCNTCHGFLRAHEGRRAGVRLCLTCHTWQNADPDTVDPAAPLAATPATSPNPLDLGRLVHRIHRGKNLPTLYRSSSTAAPPPLSPASATPPPLPFAPTRTAVNVPVAGRRFLVVGERSRPVVFGRVVTRTDNDQPARTLATGVVFPHDYRDCDACHAGAPQGGVVTTELFPRTCAGCHPDVWWADPASAPVPDDAHFAHTGGPQADATRCAACHTAAGATPYADLASFHVAPDRSPHYNLPVAEIVSVANLRPGAKPTVVFKLRDDDGPLPAVDTPTTSARSPVPRKLTRLAITAAGATEPDYLSEFQGAAPTNPLTDVVFAVPAPAITPGPLSLAGDLFTYTFSTPIPVTATGTWSISIEGRRQLSAPPYHDPSATAPQGRFPWPGTGEALNENMDNPTVYVDTAVGVSGGTARPRRVVVDEAKCNVCHLRVNLHGGNRHQVEYCATCHTPNRTDWLQRPKDASGAVMLSTPRVCVPPSKTPAGVAKDLNCTCAVAASAPAGTPCTLAATYDGREEVTIHLKPMIHRLHLGSHVGPASLALLQPHVIYGYGGSPYFFEEDEFPNDPADCTACHLGDTYAVAELPREIATVANETGTLRHAPGLMAHAAAEPAVLPMRSACNSCHATSYAERHAGLYTTAAGEEQCAQCHRAGQYGVKKVHGIPEAPP